MNVAQIKQVQNAIRNEIMAANKSGDSEADEFFMMMQNSCGGKTKLDSLVLPSP